MKINYEKLLLYLALLGAVIFFIQPLYTWFVADDFPYLMKVQRTGIFGNMWQDYKGWDGRSISLTYFMSRIGLYYGKYWVGPMIASLMVLVTSILTLKLADIRFSSKTSYFSAIMVLTGFYWLVSFNFSSQTLYWTTGIGYNLDLILLLFAAWLLKTWRQGIPFYILAAIAGFYAGTVSPNGVLALLFVLVISWMKEVIIDKKPVHFKYGFMFVFIVAGLMVVLMAPGNGKRLGAMDRANYTHIWTIYFNLKLMFSHLWKYNTALLWMGMLAGVAGAWMELKNTRRNANGIIAKVVACAYAYRWMIAAGIAFIFFLIYPALHSPRTNIHFAVFMVVFIVTQLKNMMSVTNQNVNDVFVKTGLAVLLIFVVIGASQAFDARYVKGQMFARDQKLKNLAGTDVVLTSEDVIRPGMTRRFEDVSGDTTYWLNQGVAKYYNLKTIRMELKKEKFTYGLPED